MRHTFLAAALLLIWGFAKIPWENSIDAEQRRLTRGSASPVTLKMRDELGQGLTLAALGGFRSLAATSVWLLLHSAWERQDWAWVRSYAELGVLLQPRDVYYWDSAAWQLAYNASIEVKNYSQNLSPEERLKESRRWVDEGIQMLERGIQINPDNPMLYQRLAEIYQRRLGDYRQAAHYYELATELPGCPPYLQRFPGYMLMNAGEYQQAYDYWKKKWATLSDQERKSPQWGRVREEIKKLEEKLNLPRQDRIPVS